MHVSLFVKNIEKTVSFYETFFGKKAAKIKPGYAKFNLEKPSLVISFVENGENISSGFGHLGFQLETETELHSRLTTIKESGLGALEEMGTNCCYAKQDKFWVMDPDGYRWEVYYFHEDVEWNDPHYQNTDEACCSPAMVIESPNEKEACCEPSSGCC